jgi:hypothetical protein
MNNRRDLEKLLRNAPFHADADAGRARLSELLEQWDRSIGCPGQAGGLRRHIMKSTTGKLVAAVIVLVLIGAGILRFDSRGGGLALGDIVESMQRVPWVHVTGTEQSPRENGHVGQWWESFDRRVVVSVESDGVITYWDYNAETMYVYQPQTNTVTISPTTDRFNLASPGSPAAAIKEMIAAQEEAGARVTSEPAIRDGRKVRMIHIAAKGEDMTLVCDRDSGLPLSMETIVTARGTSEQVVVSATIEYPAEGPADIYALGAPPDAQVIDNRPKGSTADLVQQVQRRCDAGFEDHIAVMLDSRVESNEALQPVQIVVLWQQGARKRMGHYVATNSAERATLYPTIKDTWPNLTIADVLGLIGDKFADFQVIFDGTTSTVWNNFSDQVRVNTHKRDLFQDDRIESLAGLAGVNPSDLMMADSDTQKKLETLPADPNHPGLVGFRIVTSPSNSSGHLRGTTTPARVASYWFDPAKDCLLIEKSSRSERSHSVTTATEIGQTPAGKWYPTEIRTASSFPGPDGKIYHNTHEQRILLDTSPVFEPGTFDAAVLRSGPSAAR